jgi:aminopeptidase N
MPLKISDVTVILFLLVTRTLWGQPPLPDRDYYKTEHQFIEKLQPYLSKAPTENQQKYDVISYRLDLDLYPDQQFLQGSVTINGRSLISGLQQIEIDLYGNLTVSTVDQQGNPVNFQHEKDLLTIDLASSAGVQDHFTLTIHYQGNPQESKYRSFGWSTHGTDQPVIWTLSEPYGSPAWWPCKDDPNDKADSVFINVSVPKDLTVASNGLLSAVTTIEDRSIYHWVTRYPISTYLVSLAISNYEVFSDWYTDEDSGPMEVRFYVYPEHLEKAKVDLPITVSMLKFFADTFGEYPFIKEKYGMAVFPWGGGMEHQTITSYGAGLIQGNHRYDYINAHELAHQWFGDAITLRHWSHIWLNEGFASYAEALWFESQYGKSYYHSYINSLDAVPLTGPLFVSDSLNEQALFSRTVYDKGSFTLHMLRGVLGDSVFFNCMSQYANDPRFAYGNATTENFQTVCEEISGLRLDWFFKQWVYRGDRPVYDILWSSAGSGPYTTVIQVRQQNTTPFKMPVQIRLQNADQQVDFTIWDSLDFQQFECQTVFKPVALLFDPDNWILKNTSLKQSAEDLRGLPEKFTVSQNFPNPFNPETRIPFSLPKESIVSLEIYNLLGELVYQESRLYPAGQYTFLWGGETNEGKMVSAGIYFYTLSIPNASASGRMILLR